MYFINEKAGEISTSGEYINFEHGDHTNFKNGLPALYRAQGANPDRKIIIWRDVCKNIHVETVYNDIYKIAKAIQKFEKGEEYWY